MAINFHDGTNHDGLFDLLGKVFYAQGRVNTARGTNAQADFLAISEAFALLDAGVDLQGIIDPVLPALSSLQSSASGSLSTLRSYARNLLVAVVSRDVTLIPKSVDAALVELVRQMEAEDETVDASMVDISVTADAENTGSCVVIATTTGGDAVARELLVPEVITAIASSSSQITFNGKPSTSDRLHQDWPSGSGITTRVGTVNLTRSILANGGMETDADTTGVPDNWTLSVGTPGTHVSLTTVAQQTVIIAGTPTSGDYVLVDTKSDGSTQATESLAYNATGATVQAALRKLAGNSSITVATTGTGPNYTHTVTFTGRGGAITALSSISRLNTGTISHATTVAGTPQVYTGGRACKITGDGSNLTTIQQAVSLSPLTVYGISLWAIADTVPAAGVITIDLVNGIGGTVLQDKAGNNQSLTFNASALSNSAWKHLSELSASTCVFRTPETIPTSVYLRIRVSTAITSTRSVFIDQVAMSPLTQLYAGGPLVGAFSGKTAVVAGDKWTVTATNDRAGLIQEWFGRNFDMARLGLVLPSDTGGSETIPDSLIA